MSGDSKFLDYEPLRNERGKGASAEDEFKSKPRPLDPQSSGLSSSKSRKSSTPSPDTEEFRRTKRPFDDSRQEFPEPSIFKETSTFKETVTRPIPSESVPVKVAPSSFTQTALKGGHTLSYVGVFVFTFFVFFRPYEYSTYLSWLSRGALVTAIVTLLIFLPAQLGLENRLTIRTREVNTVLVLLGLGLLSIVFAVDRFMAWNSFVEFIKVVVIFIVMVNVIRNEGRLRKLLLLILVASCALSVLAINDYRTNNFELGGRRIAGAIGGIFENPNDLALHLVTFFPIVIALALAAKNPFSKLIYFIAALSMLAGTVVTFSRGGFLGLIFVIGALFWNLLGKNRILVIAITVVMVGAFLGLAGGAYRQRIATTRDDSAAARTGELKRSIHVALRNPLLGVGMDNFVIFSNTAHATHNAYTQVASEIGIPAGIIYVLFLIAALRRMKRVPHPRDMDQRDKSLGYLAIGVQAGLIGYVVSSFFASVAYLWYVYYLAAYAIAIWRIWEARQAVNSSGLKSQTVI
jgi:O-antigen ligase